jgi:hypothetical protein
MRQGYRIGCKFTYNLGKIKRVITNGIEDKILELVDYSKQILAERSHCDVKMPKRIVSGCAEKGSRLRVGNRASSSRFGVLSLSQIYCCSVARPQQTQ